MVTKGLNLFFLFTLWFGAHAQTTVLVLDHATQKPLAGAHIVLQPKTAGKGEFAITNFQGKANLNCGTEAEMLVSFLGYQNYAAAYQPGENIMVALKPTMANLNEFVVTANTVPTKVEDNIFQTKIIDAEKITEKGANNLREALMNELNIRVSQDNILGTGIQMNGVGGENVKIMVDGVPIIGRLNGNIDLSQINLNNVQKIEIIEGPMSVNFGSNALGGVINIITNKQQTNPINMQLNSYYETVGNYNFDGALGIQHGKNLWQISGGRYFFDGFSPNENSRWQQWKPKEQYFSDVAYSRSLGRFNLRVNGNAFREIIQSKGSPLQPFEINASDQYFTTYRYNSGAFFNGYFNPKHHIDITASYNYFTRTSETFFKDLVTLAETPTDQNTENFGLAMSRGIYSFLHPQKRFSLQAGYELNAETAEGKRIDGNFKTINELAVFTSTTFKLFNNKLEAKPAVRYTYNSAYQTIPTPALNLKYAANKNLVFRGSYARGFRSPTLKELYFVFVDINHNIFGNKQLRPETSHNFTASANLTKSTEKLNFNYSLSGFYNSIQNQIRSVAQSVNLDSLLYKNQNIAWFKSTGIKAGIEADAEKFNLGLLYGYTGTQNSVNINAVGENNFLFFSELQANATLKINRINGKVNLFYKLNGAQPFIYTKFDEETNLETLEQGIVSGFNMFDASYTQLLLNQQIQVGLFAKNLFNVTNIAQTQGANTGGAHTTNSGSLPAMWGRSFAIKVSYFIR